MIHTDGNEIQDTVAAVVGTVREAQWRSVPPEVVRDAVLEQAERAASEEARAALEQAETREAALESAAPAASRPRRAPTAVSPAGPPLADHITPFIELTDWFGRTMMACLTRVRIEGLDGALAIDGPLIVASNHASNADGILIASWLTPALGRKIHWLGKQEALDWPILGWAIGQNGVFGVRRGAADLEAFRAAKRVLDEGHVLCVFPEGTRSPDGALQEAKDGAAILALRSGAPILPVGISGTHRFWPRGGAPRIGKTVRMRVGEPFTLPVVTGDRRRAYGEATRTIMTRIAKLLPERQRGFYRDAAEG